LVRYFPKGAAHTVQGLDEENEYLLVFDEADFDKVGYVSKYSCHSSPIVLT
jgi:hypothetical protein